MRLKRLELFGFKSFADRTVFEFGDSTLTGVVGPNGCGKSNVVDSVRWVLGEQRPTSMRGSEMTDVIFKGSTSRAALSVAEVTLILDNGSARLESRGAEVSITRRVFRSGEGEYLIDGDPVRLKDVREMLFDTGLGSRGYSVLEQGRIDAVLSANPLERRRIFEEAAGISRYRQRKTETELRLKKVADDMARLDDLLGELSTRVRSLKIQSGKAERYVAAREEWAREKARLFRHELWIAGRDLAGLTGKLREIEGTLGRAKAERARSEERAALLEGQRASLQAEIERQADLAGRLAGDGRALDERRAHLAARAAGLESDAREEGERAARLDQALAERVAELQRLEDERAALAVEVAQEERTEAERARALAETERAVRDRRARHETARGRGLEILAEMNRAENRVRSLGEALERAWARAERAREELEASLAAEKALAEEVAALEGEAQRSETERAEREETRRGLERELALVADELQKSDQERGTLEVERARAQSGIEFLLDRERDLEELSKAARTLLGDAGPGPARTGLANAERPCAPEDLCGLVADHLRTDTEHARALDAALAARGRAIVARDREAARAVAAWLKARETGQIGLLLGAGLAPAARSLPAAPEGPEAELVRGRLLDRVRSTPGCERLAEILVGDVFVARDLDAAMALAERRPDLRFVTLEGDLADAAGLLAGSGALAQGAVGRRSSAAELRVELERISARIAALEEGRAALAARQATLAESRKHAGLRLEEALAARTAAESRLATARARHKDVDLDRPALESESEGATVEVAGLEADLAAETLRRDEARTGHEAARVALADLEREVAEGEIARAAAEKGAAEARVLAARARERLEGLTRRHADLSGVLRDNRAEMERARRLAAEHARSVLATRAEIEVAASEIARILVERGQVEERLRELRTRDESERDALAAARGSIEALQRDLDAAQSALSDHRLEEQRLSLSRQEILRRASEELALDEAALLADFTPEEGLQEAAGLAALAASVHEQKERLDKLGPVNMEAMAELTEVGGRLEFLQKQREDLARAREALGSTLQTIDVESKRLFLETFHAVRDNFQRIFRQLFGGGRAEVSLEEGVDVLEAGVEIMARPPGRELLPIGLLSGGQRTLTALALLFAVFEARPSPFCILDEVDAALDDANIERFLAMLDGYRTSTQFVVVTHNKGTMAACQGLYGVTMETKGVSRQVAVELDEVDHWASSNGSPGPIGPISPISSGEPVESETGPPAEVPRESPAPDPRSSSGLDPETGEPLVEIVPMASMAPIAPMASGEAASLEGIAAREGPPASPARPRRSRARRSSPPEGETAGSAFAPDASE